MHIKAIFCATLLWFLFDQGIMHAMDNEQLFQLKMPAQEQLNNKFMKAAKERDIKNTSKYLCLGAHIDTPQINGRTALIELCYQTKANKQSAAKDIISLLLHNKADVNCRDSFGLSALDYAALQDATDIMELLLHAEAQLKGELPVTPCHTAAYHKAYIALKLLHKYSAPMNTLDKKGLAPLHHAVNGIGPIAELLTYGAPLDQATKGVSGNGKRCGGKTKYPAKSTAFHLAAQHHYSKNGNLATITHCKSTLLYHALFYGTISQKDALHFVWCIKQCAPGLYCLRRDLLIPCMLSFKPQTLILMLHSSKTQARALARQMLAFRANTLAKILMQRNADGKTAYDIELAAPFVNAEYAAVLNPSSIATDYQAYLEAEVSRSVAKLPLSNPFKIAYELIPQPQAHKSKMLFQTVKKKLKKAFKG